jgi:quinol monooxygenase YgiN
MTILPRRDFLACAIGVVLQGESMTRFGLHGKLTAHPGQRDALLAILLDAADLVGAAPGCEIYFVSTSHTEPDALWVTEVWRSEADHAASLSLPGVKELIVKAKPLIASMSDAARTIPVGGKGLPVRR